jgi:DNA-binding CsgD family transcriptional regulator
MDQQINMSLFLQLAVFSYDITEQKKNELLLKEKEISLRIQAEHLNEANAALRNLLSNKAQHEKELAHNLTENVKRLIDPFIKNIKKTQLDVRQKSILNIIESNIHEIVSPMTRKLSTGDLNLTSAEIRIANLIKHGHTSKEISTILNISSKTVATHRKNIRKKIGIDHKNENLRFHLLSMESQTASDRN